MVKLKRTNEAKKDMYGGFGLFGDKDGQQNLFGYRSSKNEPKNDEGDDTIKSQFKATPISSEEAENHIDAFNDALKLHASNTNRSEINNAVDEAISNVMGTVVKKAKYTRYFDMIGKDVASMSSVCRDMLKGVLHVSYCIEHNRDTCELYASITLASCTYLKTDKRDARGQRKTTKEVKGANTFTGLKVSISSIDDDEKVARVLRQAIIEAYTKDLASAK